uniref:CACN subunit beta associated regulatory protein b n=1 Tax=Electrophorus electricus TaxID=8005 RepID=A0A4W4H8F6_ELEEL
MWDEGPSASLPKCDCLFSFCTGRFILCFRARDDPEKITTPYLEETQPVHGSSHDEETERFLSTGTTGRRVSFNEAALFDHGKKAQEKGRRYTLTEGDFHHLKNARLTHLHLPPSTLKIVTIHECETAENSIAMATRPVTKSSLSIFQVMPAGELAGNLSGSPSSALPGDTLNSTVDTTFCESPPALGPEPPSPRARNGGSPGSGRERLSVSAARPCSLVSGPQGPVVQFFTKLRRHASLEGASPYFKIKRWRFGSSQRASSLDTRGSPKRRPFQRQRAASESTDQDEPGTRHIDLIQYIARTKDVAYCPSRSPAPPPYIRATGPGAIGTSAEPQDEALGVCCRQDSMDPQSLYRDIWTLRASLEKHVSSDQSSNNDKDSVHSDADSRDGELSRDEALEKPRKQDSWDSERGSDGESGTRKLLQMDSGYASIEAPCRTSEEAASIQTSLTRSWKRSPRAHVPPLSRRDYSIDEKTDALFHEFLRHDPQFDQQGSPLRPKHRSRVHLRKQWQRSKQHSDPGQRFHTSFDRYRVPLRRGETVNYPLESSYHSTLPRIVSAPDEENSEGSAGLPDTLHCHFRARLMREGWGKQVLGQLLRGIPTYFISSIE